MKIYISGGAKNGKTALAQKLACEIAKDGRRVYLATMIPKDDEDRARIEKHIAERRGLGFETAEEGRDILSVLGRYGNDCVYLIDSITALLENTLYPLSGFSDNPKVEFKKLLDDLCEFCDRAENVIFVSDYIFSEYRAYSHETYFYMKSLAAIDKTLCKKCDKVIEMSGGNIIYARS